jgi:Mn2+/Fe2+ NRAMP family transporter
VLIPLNQADPVLTGTVRWLPFLLIFMLIFVNRKELMGDYRNSKLANVIAWSTSIIIIVLTIAMIWTTSVGQ